MHSSEDAYQLLPTPKVSSVRPFTLAIYVATLLLSALLIFAIQPMFAKMVLPRLGRLAVRLVCRHGGVPDASPTIR